MVNPALSPPPKMATAVINHWNSQPHVAAIPRSGFEKERRYVVAALKTMTSQTIPNWDEAWAKVHYAIKAYADIRNDPQNYEYVHDRTLSQLLKWELVRFLEVNQPHMRLRKDKTRIPETGAIGKKRKPMSKRDAKWWRDMAKRCEGCAHKDARHGCPEESGMSAGLRKDGKYECHVPKGKK